MSSNPEQDSQGTKSEEGNGKQRFVAIDSNSLMHRAYHAYPPNLATSQGLQVNAVYGFTSMLLKVLKELTPKYLVCAFDLAEPTFRHEQFEEYKANRKPPDESLVRQFPVAKDVLKAFNVPILEKKGFEADDILGTLGYWTDYGKWKSQGLEQVIVTGDKDLLQMVDENTNVWLPRGSFKNVKMFDRDEVKELFDFGPEYVVDYKAMVGDSSDNIPGVKGVGKKTATKLIKKFGHLEDIYENLDSDFLTDRERKLLKEDKENAEISYELAKIISDLELDLDLEDCLLKDFDYQEVVSKFRELEFRSLLDKIPESLDREKSNSGINGNGQIGLFVEEAVSVSGEVDGSSDRAKAGKVQGAGLEVVSVDEFANIGDGHEERDGESDDDRSEDSGNEGSGNGDSGDDDSEGNSGLLYVAFFEKDNTIVFSSDLEDIETVDRGADSGDRGDRGDISDNSEVAKVYFDKKIEQKEDFWKRAKKIFDGGFEEVVFFGWKDFCEFLYFNDLVGFDSTKKSEEAHLDETKEILMMDFSKTRLFDTQLAAYFLSTGKRDYSFKELAFSYAGFVVDNQSPASPAEAVNYLQALRVVSQKLREDLVKHQSEERFIKEGGDLELDCLKDVDQVMSISCTAMTDIGIAIDRDQLGEIQADFEQRIDKVEKEIFDSVGHEFNINSPKQLSEVLFEELDLPPQKRTKTGFSTSESVLKQLKDMHPCVENVLEYRELMKLNSTYVKPLINFSKKSKDGRIHSSFNQITTSTGRLSSTEPNVQNIPTRTDLGKKIKGMFVAPEGRELISADYSQIELRIMAHLSQDKNMIDDFRSEKDFHTQTAVRLLDVEKDSVSQDDRRIAKTINFGVLYGQSPYGLAKQLDIDRSQASDYIESYFDKYSGVKSYLEKTINFAKKYGYLETLLGRRRYFGSIASSNRNARAGAEREAINLPIQGSAADIMRIAMNRVYEWILENDPTSHLLLQIHDELVIETSKNKSSEIAPIIKGIMENVIDLGVPLLVEPNIGPNLREAK